MHVPIVTLRLVVFVCENVVHTQNHVTFIWRENKKRDRIFHQKYTPFFLYKKSGKCVRINEYDLRGPVEWSKVTESELKSGIMPETFYFRISIPISEKRKPHRAYMVYFIFFSFTLHNKAQLSSPSFVDKRTRCLSDELLSTCVTHVFFISMHVLCVTAGVPKKFQEKKSLYFFSLVLQKKVYNTSKQYKKEAHSDK